MAIGRVLREKAAALPPAQRVDHLHKRHREERDRLKSLVRAQEATEAEIHRLQERLKEEVSAVDDQRGVLSVIQTELEDAELQLPPKGRPLPAGLVQDGNKSDEMSFEEMLEAIYVKLHDAAGGSSPTCSTAGRTCVCGSAPVVVPGVHRLPKGYGGPGGHRPSYGDEAPSGAQHAERR